MEKKLIKIFNPEKAKELADLGFRYILDSINGQSIYAFFVSEKLLKYINSNFDSKDFFLDNMLHF